MSTTTTWIAPTSGIYQPSWDTSGAMVTIVGGAPQWADNLDTTYSEHQASTVPQPLAVANFIAYSNIASVDLSAGITVRTMQDFGSGGAQPWVEWRLRGISDGAIVAYSNSGTLPFTLAPGDVSIPVDTVNEAPEPRIAAGDLAIEIYGARTISANRFRIYEVSMQITTNDGPAPACRKFPREDGQGVGSARHFPVPRSLQASPRRAGGYY